MGLLPIETIAEPVAVVHVAPEGLQTPITTVPPFPEWENGSAASTTAGAMIVKMMFEPFTMFAMMFVLFTTLPADTMPTRVRNAGSLLLMNSEPVSTKVKAVPELAVGRLAGLIPVTVAPAA